MSKVPKSVYTKLWHLGFTDSEIDKIWKIVKDYITDQNEIKSKYEIPVASLITNEVKKLKTEVGILPVEEKKLSITKPRRNSKW